MTEEVYVTMKSLGTELGRTSHQIGKKLKDLGLRNDDGKPSQFAFDSGFVAQKWTQDHSHYLWAWHRAKTLKTLAAVGVKPKEATPSDFPK